MTTNETVGRRRRWGFGGGLAFGAVLMGALLWGSARRDLSSREPMPAEDPAAGDGVHPGAAGVAGGGPAAGDTARTRPFRRRDTTPGVAAAPPWGARVRTNGVYDPTRSVADRDYARQVRAHLKLKALLTSPARDTAACRAVIALAERHGVPLAAVPELYHALWECRALEREQAEAPSEARAQAVDSVRRVALADFMRRFESDFTTDPGGLFEELLALPVTPTTPFGGPQWSVAPGEVLLAE